VRAVQSRKETNSRNYRKLLFSSRISCKGLGIMYQISAFENYNTKKHSTVLFYPKTNGMFVVASAQNINNNGKLSESHLENNS